MELFITHMKLENRLSALLQLDLHSQLNTWLQWIGQRQLHDETINIYVWGLGATYIRELTVLLHDDIMGYACATYLVFFINLSVIW